MFKKACIHERMNSARMVDPGLFDRLMSMVDRNGSAECWLSHAGLNQDGYSIIRVGGRKTGAHRAIFSLFFPGIYAQVVRHMCHKPNCINPAHLRAGTPKDNAEDRVIAGRGGNLKGTCNGRAKLSNEQVAEILSSNESGASLARRMGVSKVMVCRIRRGDAWTHIERGIKQ